MTRTTAQRPRAPARRVRGAALAASIALLAPAARAQDPPRGAAAAEPVTLNLDGTPLAKVLRSFAEEYRLNIVAGSEVTGTVTMSLFDVPVEDALRAVLAVNGYGLRRSGEFLLVERLVAPEAAPPEAEPVETRVVWLDYLRADEALKLIAPLKSELGVHAAGSPAETGLPSDPSKAGGDSPAGGEVLILRDRRSVLAEVLAILAELDRRPRQVLVEATILEVTLDDETSLGIDFNTLSGVNFTDLNGVSTLNAIAHGPFQGENLVKGVAGAGTFGFASDANTDGLHIGILTDDVALFIEALERVTNATILANPRVLAVDRQRAEIIIGAKLGYLTSTTTETATVQEVEFLDTGTQLRFRPFIAGDGYVRLEVHPENSTGVVDAVSGLPSEQTTEVTTNVLVKDGDTIAIGGLIGEQVETVTRQIPGLGSIPYLGALFRRTTDSMTRREVIVLLTPHIVDPGLGDAAGVAQGDAMAANRDAVFGRQLPVSRVRLAAPYAERAERLLAAGDAEAALCCAEIALDLVPGDVRSSKLRRRALAELGRADSEKSALETLEGLR